MTDRSDPLSLSLRPVYAAIKRERRRQTRVAGASGTWRWGASLAPRFPPPTGYPLLGSKGVIRSGGSDGGVRSRMKSRKIGTYPLRHEAAICSRSSAAWVSSAEVLINNSDRSSVLDGGCLADVAARAMVTQSARQDRVPVGRGCSSGRTQPTKIQTHVDHHQVLINAHSTSLGPPKQ